MQKSPITIEEDLHDLFESSENDLVALIKEVETFFAPITFAIESLLNPHRTIPVDETVDPATQKPGAKAGSQDPKKVDPKAKPAAPPKGKALVKG